MKLNQFFSLTLALVFGLQTTAYADGTGSVSTVLVRAKKELSNAKSLKALIESKKARMSDEVYSFLMKKIEEAKIGDAKPSMELAGSEKIMIKFEKMQVAAQFDLFKDQEIVVFNGKKIGTKDVSLEELYNRLQAALPQKVSHQSPLGRFLFPEANAEVDLIAVGMGFAVAAAVVGIVGFLVWVLTELALDMACPTSAYGVIGSCRKLDSYSFVGVQATAEQKASISAKLKEAKGQLQNLGWKCSTKSTDAIRQCIEKINSICKAIQCNPAEGTTPAPDAGGAR